jgi:hypothetical protein
MMKIRYALTALAFLQGAVLANISGYVRNDINNGAVTKAFVRIVNVGDSTLEANTVTDMSGHYSLALPITVGTTRGHSGISSPTLALERNQPNPVTGMTLISFMLPRQGVAELSIFSMSGKLIDRVTQKLSAGRHSITWRPAAALPCGAYLYRLRWNGISAERVMLVAKGSRLPFGQYSGSGHAVPQTGMFLAKAASPDYRFLIYGRGVYPLRSAPVTLTDGMTKDFTLKYVDLWDSSRVILRDSMVNSHYQFQKARQGRVVFLGGSVTNNPGWRDSVMAYLRSKFPQTTFTFVNAGVPSVGSNMHAFRIKQDIFSSGKIDLLFADFAGNDTINNIRDNINKAARFRAMEGIIRQARVHNPNIDIVSLYIAFDAFYPPVAAYDSIPFLEAYERPSWYYGVTCVNLAQYVAERYTWAQFGGDVHPGLYGTQIYARVLRHFFDAAWKDSLPVSAQITRCFHPVRVLDSLCYQYGHYDSIKTAQIVSGWTYVASWRPTGTAGTRDGFVNVPALEATAAGARLTFSFTGTAVGVVSPEGPDVGILTYQIDNTINGSVDQYTPWSSGLHIPWIWMFATSLSNTNHTLTLIVANTKNGSSTGYASRIMQFAVNGQ